MLDWSALLLSSAASALAVFVLSFLVHMVLRWHQPHYRPMEGEDAVRAAMGSPPPGQYVLPYCADMKEMASEAMVQKFQTGPNCVVYVGPNRMPAMGPMLGAWFLLSFAVALAAGVVAQLALPRAAEFGAVFPVVALPVFLAFATGPACDSVWMHKPWAVSRLYALDAVLYAAASGAVFAWLWPS